MFNYGYPYFAWEYVAPSGSGSNNGDQIIVDSGSNTFINNNIIYSCSEDLYQTYENITLEIWKRILNNLPFLYKTKGTVRGLRALITSYGIPSSILYVREYGGPDLDFENKRNITEYKLDNFIPVLPFYASQSIELDWSNNNSYSKYPSAVQLRFSVTGSDYTLLNSMSLVEVKNKWCISAVPVGYSGMGYIKFQLSTGAFITSSNIPIYDGNYTFINLQRETSSDASIDQIYTLSVKKYLYGSILYESIVNNTFSSSQHLPWRQSGSLLIGGLNSTFAMPFYGNIDEFRLWNTPLIEYVIDTHVKFPESYIGNTVTASYEDLLLRFSFDNPINMASYHTQSFTNDAPSKNYDISNLKINGWSNSPDFPYSYITDTYEGEARFINIGISRYSSNKVRIESGSLKHNLSPTQFSEVGEYDDSPLDSNKLGIFFSPTEIINEDIIKKLAISDMGDLIGDPRDRYLDRYSNLNNLSVLYWKLGGNRISVSDYLNYIKYYDPSLFDHIREFIPARCQALLGVLYEPHALERQKVKNYIPKVNKLDYSKTIKLVENLDESVYGDYNVINTNIKMNYISSKVENFENSNIYSIIDVNSFVSSSHGTIFPMVSSVVDFDSNLIYSSGSIGNIKISNIQQYSFDSGYSKRHYKYHEGYYTWEKRLKYLGCKQTEDTSIDKLPSIEVWDTNPNKLTARNDGISNLQVI